MSRPSIDATPAIAYRCRVQRLHQIFALWNVAAALSAGLDVVRGTTFGVAPTLPGVTAIFLLASAPLLLRGHPGALWPVLAAVGVRLAQGLQPVTFIGVVGAILWPPVIEAALLLLLRFGRKVPDGIGFLGLSCLCWGAVDMLWSFPSLPADPLVAAAPLLVGIGLLLRVSIVGIWGGILLGAWGVARRSGLWWALTGQEMVRAFDPLDVAWALLSPDMVLLGVLLGVYVPLLAAGPRRGVTRSCGSCGAEVPAHTTTGQRCPHCLAWWSFERTAR